MMTISLSDVSKRFNRDWIFRKFSYNFSSDHSYAITGPNGSGKSTLLQVIAGAIVMSEGVIRYEIGSGEPRDGKPRAQLELEGSRGEPVGRTLDLESAGAESRPGRISNASSNSSKESGIKKVDNPDKNDKAIPVDDAYKYISIAAPYLELIEEMTATEFLKFHHTFKPLLPGWEVGRIITVVGLEQAANKQIRYYSSGMKQRMKLAQAFFSNTPVILLDEPCTNLDVEGVQLYQELVKLYCRNRLVIVSSNEFQEYSFCEQKISIMDYK